MEKNIGKTRAMSTRQVVQIPDDPTSSFEPAMVENLPVSIDDNSLELSTVVSGLNASIHPVTLVSLEDASGIRTDPLTKREFPKGLTPESPENTAGYGGLWFFTEKADFHCVVKTAI